MNEPLLRVRGLQSGHGKSLVIQGIDIDVDTNHIVALLGRNGVGKSTLVETLMGMIPMRAGSVRLDGQELAGLEPHEISRMGVALVPQGRRIFSRLTVEENLEIAARSSRARDDIRQIYVQFPSLARRRENRGNQLSGGEQQMLAIARAVVSRPRLVLLDEPSEGLAPVIVEEVTAMISHFRDRGISAIVVEQNLRMAMDLADTVCIMEKGVIVHTATVAEFAADSETKERLLGV